MNPARAFEEIRRLCTSGSPSRLVVPVVARLLGPALGVGSSFFFWLDEDGEVREVFVHPSAPRGLLELYAEEFHDSREADALPRFSDSVRAGSAVATLELSERQRRRSAFYHEILRPIGSEYQAWLTLRDGPHPLGLMALHRELRAGPFGDHDVRRLHRVEQLLVHCLTAPVEIPPTTVEGESAMLLLSDGGELLHATTGSARLLAMAAQRLNWLRAADEHPDRLLPDPVRRLADRLVTADTGTHGPPPLWETANGWGRFTFRAYPLDPVSDDRRVIAVSVTRNVSAPFLVATAVTLAPLSPRQKELCVLLAHGGSYADIAARMNISRHTVVEYAQAVFDRLGVRGRQALMEKLTRT